MKGMKMPRHSDRHPTRPYRIPRVIDHFRPLPFQNQAHLDKIMTIYREYIYHILAVNIAAGLKFIKKLVIPVI